MSYNVAFFCFLFRQNLFFSLVQLLLPPCCLLEPSSAFLLHQVLAFVTIVVAWSESPKTTTKTARRRRSRNIHICFVFAKWTAVWHEHGWSRERENQCWETWSRRVLIYRGGEGKGKGYKEKKETWNIYMESKSCSKFRIDKFSRKDLIGLCRFVETKQGIPNANLRGISKCRKHGTEYYFSLYDWNDT